MSEFDAYNDSELVRIAQLFDAEATRGYGRERLIALIENEEFVDRAPRGINQARHNIFKMVDFYWSQVETLINCPMENRDPRACFQCTDVQVAECSVLNHDLIKKVTEETEHE